MLVAPNNTRDRWRIQDFMWFGEKGKLHSRGPPVDKFFLIFSIEKHFNYPQAYKSDLLYT